MITDTDLRTDTEQRPDSDLDYHQEPEQPNTELAEYELLQLLPYITYFSTFSHDTDYICSPS